jgi:hypothetical protein
MGTALRQVDMQQLCRSCAAVIERDCGKLEIQFILSRRSLYAVANNHRVAVTASGCWAGFLPHFESLCGNVERRLLSEGSADEWERARREIPKSARRRTANSAERTLTAVMAVPHPGLREKSRTFPEAESATVKPCDRAAVSLPPQPSACRDSQPIAASSSAAREGAPSGCRHARSDEPSQAFLGRVFPINSDHHRCPSTPRKQIADSGLHVQ